MCNLDGGLWPFFWIAVVVCATIIILKRNGAKAQP
jgi:hypothetical protein